MDPAAVAAGAPPRNAHIVLDPIDLDEGPITYPEVTEAINKMKLRKAGGPDEHIMLQRNCKVMWWNGANICYMLFELIVNGYSYACISMGSEWGL